MTNRILLITDNQILLDRFKKLIDIKIIDNNFDIIIDYAFSPANTAFKNKFIDTNWIKPLNVKKQIDFLVQNYKMIFSLHCKQLFPAELVSKVKCINIHPGLNPYNRGWFPQVFSIINGLPCGATIHEIDEHLDHGPIICQKEIKLQPWDTSFTMYNKILDAEMELLEHNIDNLLLNNYKTFTTNEGNLNLKKDFDALCEINLNDIDTFQNHLNKLRALTHGNYSNAYFLDADGNKIGIKIELENIKN